MSPSKDFSEEFDNPAYFINRELSLLDFQQRVLEEAHDKNTPLLERVKFLSIFGSNMDEFFMVRVSGIRKLVEANVVEISPDGKTPRELLAAIRKRALELYKEAHLCYQREILPELEKTGIHILDYKKLNDAQRGRADTYFTDVVFPVLTPLALDPGHPFPHISNLSFNFAIVIRDKKGIEKFARLKVPDTLQQMVPVKRSSGGARRDGTVPWHHYFVWLEQVIAANLDALFPGMEIVEAHPFRIIRDADIEIQELEADDLLEAMQLSIRRRKFASVVKVAIYENMPSHLRELLIENLQVRPTDVYVTSSNLGLARLWQLYSSIDRHDLKFLPYKQAVSKQFSNASVTSDIFEIIQQGNVLLHHPYDSFSPVIDFLNASARDPDVLAIKQTLYRTGQNSPIVEALLEAAEYGKQVAVLVELKARFDEESNIGWAQTLEQAGVHVVYGLVGLKTHCKITMVVRKEGESIRRYIHMATGNYNAVTSSLYEDIGLFTADETIGEDATDLYNYLTGYSTKQDYKKLLVAPVNLRERLEKFIYREIEHAKNKRPARLIFKTNSLVDQRMIQLLYEASRVGVKIDLLIRGICSLIPGIKDVSENIRVISVLGRYLEHSRIYYFHNDGKDEIYLGSADLMSRNLNHRVEVAFPIERTEHIRYLRDHVLETYLKDNTNARIMQSDGTYKRVKPSDSKKDVDVQKWLMENPPGKILR